MTYLQRERYGGLYCTVAYITENFVLSHPTLFVWLCQYNIFFHLLGKVTLKSSFNKAQLLTLLLIEIGNGVVWIFFQKWKLIME